MTTTTRQIVTATYKPLAITVQVLSNVNEDRFSITTLDGRKPWCVQTHGGPVDTDYIVTSRALLDEIAVVVLPCAHLHTEVESTLTVEDGFPMYSERLICTDCMEEIEPEPALDLGDYAEMEEIPF